MTSKVDHQCGRASPPLSLLPHPEASWSKRAASPWRIATGKVNIQVKGGEGKRGGKQQLKSTEAGKIDQWPQEQSILITVIKSCPSILWILNIVDWRQQVCFHVPHHFLY